jgi:hypothetical protein
MFLIKEIGVATVPGRRSARRAGRTRSASLSQDGRHADRGGPAAAKARPVTPRAAARAIFDAALGAGDVRPLVLHALGAVRLPSRGRVIVAGAGKASGAMAAAVEAALGDRVSGGVIAVKDGHLVETRRIRLLEAGHPVPDERVPPPPVKSSRSPGAPAPTTFCSSSSRGAARR